jgi:hypothetical protein
MENAMDTTLLLRLALATACAVGASSAAQAKIVAEPEMAAFCTGEAAAKLGTRPRNILTLPVEKSGGKYIVYGQSPADGADVTTFECKFGSDRKYQGIKITGRPAGGGSADNGGAPQAAMARCRDMVGVGLCCTNRVRDSFRESSVVAVQYEQTHTPRLQDQELARL